MKYRNLVTTALVPVVLLCLAAMPLLARGSAEGTPHVIAAGGTQAMPEPDAKIFVDAGIPTALYVMTLSQFEGRALRTYSRPSLTQAQLEQSISAVRASIEHFHATMPGLKEVVGKLGNPTSVLIYEDARGVDLNAFFGSTDFYFHSGAAEMREIRQDRRQWDYAYKGILPGATLKQVTAVLGEPVGTVYGNEYEMQEDRVLSVVSGGQGGSLQQYISYARQGVRVFFDDGVAMAIYLFMPGTMPDGSPVGSRPTTAVPEVRVTPYADVRFLDLRAPAPALDVDAVRALTFNGTTQFPPTTARRAAGVMEEGKNPGLGIRSLHAQGISGAGVTVAIIDQNLPGTGHPEYAGKVVQYKDLGTGQASTWGSMHGPAVLSLLVGETTGTAPGARVYYAAAPSWTGDAKYYGDALRWIVDENRKLPADRKIRVASVSAAPSGTGSPFTKNGAEWDNAVKLAGRQGILVLDCTTTYGKIGPAYYDPKDPESAARALPGWPGVESTSVSPLLLAPTSYRTTAESYRAEQNGWQYTGRGGLSWGIPWAAGVLAMGWQVNPSLSPTAIMKLLADTCFARPDGSKIIDPVAFVAAAKKAR